MRTSHVVNLDSEIPLEQCAEFSALMTQIIHEGLAAEGVDCPCEVNVLFTDDAGIKEINKEQRGMDKATDVLSFPMLELQPGQLPTTDDAEPATGLVPLGDMVLSHERLCEQAADFGHSLRRELGYLTVHSLLHLLGYDHMDEGEEKAKMRAREEAILAQLGITREEE